MSALADFERVDSGSGGAVLRFTGNLSLASLGDLPDRLDTVDGAIASIDLSQVERIDTVGAWVVHRFAREKDAKVEGLEPASQHLFDQVVAAEHPIALPPKPESAFVHLLAEIGDAVFTAAHTLYGLLGFMGATVIAFWNVATHPRRFRFHATVHRFEVVGVSALGIIGLMSFLIGVVIAQQGAVQLRHFAAQIGTMKITEEIDAMRTIGVSPMEALVVPRTIAVVTMLPLLGFYSALIAIIGGGLLCWVQLDIPPITFVQRIREVVPLNDLWVGLIKAPVFGAIIAIAGCFQGMQVEGDAEQVGRRTTTAVVQAIFLVIVLDAFFAVFFSQIGWI
jgi:phospholipid/cholesterol/gamma-HCH transport system permease protein